MAAPLTAAVSAGIIQHLRIPKSPKRPLLLSLRFAFSLSLADTRPDMRDWPGLGGHSCDPRTLLPLESAFTVVTFLPASPHLSLGLDEDEDGKPGGMGVEQLMGREGSTD